MPSPAEPPTPINEHHLKPRDVVKFPVVTKGNGWVAILWHEKAAFNIVSEDGVMSWRWTLPAPDEGASSVHIGA